MQGTETDQRIGLEALRNGDMRRAREYLAKAMAGGRTDPATLLALANACRQLDDQAGKLAAVDRLLEADPRNLRALLIKADHLAASGDARSAASFYMAALRNAPPANQVPADLLPELRRAQEMNERYAAQYQEHLIQSLRAKGFDPGRSSPRFAQSLDIVLGRRQIFMQQPRYFYFPGLPQIQFYDRELFPWMDALERATDDVRAELLGVLEEPGAFSPYVTGDANRPRREQAGLLNNPAWSAYFLWKNGEPVPGNAARCPKTLAALKDAPLCRVPNRSPSILFSLMKAGTHIPPHNGLINTRLICHLPVLVPGPAEFRVGNEVRPWIHGKAWAFDDTIEHEAWNRADATRVILLFDIWRPEVSEEEQALVVALFEAIDAYSGEKPEWSI
jgi:aspartyl/asparaginyl beta-hydroxylase (cupin superfamily)